ncbi:MAG: ABC transporter ATP-binding protein [Selenomonadaceae bacterium]|nr:ABC transporter ATP-binding protein [Selenomonadaceae bacterium]
MNDLSIRNLSAAYEDRSIFSNLDFDFRGCVSIIGRSGCGKSTLLKTIAGIVKPSSGKILLDGFELDPRKNLIGFMPQSFGLLPWKTVRENIELACRIKNQPIDRETFASLIYRLGLFGMEDRYPRELSGGQRQRVAVGRNFLLHPELLLMDEPFSALDAITREELQLLFLELRHDFKPTTILVTHDVDEAILLGDSIVLMSNGKLNRIEPRNDLANFLRRSLSS